MNWSGMIRITMCVRKLRRNIAKYIAILLVSILALFTLYPSNGQPGNSYPGNSPSWLSWTRKLLYLSVSPRRPVHVRTLRHNKSMTSLIDCEALAIHNKTEINRVQTLLRTERWADLTTDDYTRKLGECGSFILDQGYLSLDSDDTLEFPLAYIFMVDTDDITQIERVINSVYSTHNFYCLHLDKTTKREVYETVLLFTSCFNNVFIAGRREEIFEGTFSSVQAQLNCMNDLLVTSTSWKYVIKLTPSTFPLTSQSELVTQLQRLRGLNYLPSSRVSLATIKRTASDLVARNAVFEDLLYRHTLEAKDDVVKFRRTSYMKPKPPNDQPLFYSDSTHYLLTRDFIFHILTDETAKKITQWFEDVRNPDFFIWGTLDHSPRAPSRGGGPRTVPGFPEIVTEKLAPVLRLPGDMKSPPCYGYYDAGSCVFGVGDLTWILKQHSLFARHFSLTYDHFVLQCVLDKINQGG